MGSWIRAKARARLTRANTIVQGPRGGTRRIYTPKAGGEKLDVRVIMFSKRLSKPVTYHLEYARQPEPAAAAMP